MQEPAGVDEMNTVSIADTIWLASCEKPPLFRHGILLPKIECFTITESKMGPSIVILVYIADQVQLKTDTRYSVLPFDHHEIITST
jgi:hypothetical protein